MPSIIGSCNVGRLVPVGVRLAAIVAVTGCATPVPRSVGDRVEALMKDLVARELFQGAVVVAVGDSVHYAAGFGFADREARVPFTPDTPSDGGSIAKTFTAAALLLLAAEGRLDLDRPVREILPEYPHAVTRVRHLLGHSAGLPGFQWLDARVPPGEVRTNAGHLALVARDAPAPAFPPGTAFEYDNVAWDVAAMVVERVAGTSYQHFVAERFSAPLGLGAFVRPARFVDWPGARTRGYRRTAAGWEDHDAFDLEGFHGASNIYLSARDLHRWMTGYRRVMPPEAVEAALTPMRLEGGRATGISLGSWYLSADRTRRYYTGHHNGFFTVGYADDSRGLTVAWVANDTPPPWLQPALTRALVAIADGRDAPAPIAPAVGDTAIDPAGTYHVPGLGDVVVTSDTAGVRVLAGSVEYQAFPVGDGVRYLPGLDAYLRFTAAPDGRVSLSWDAVFAVTPEG